MGSKINLFYAEFGEPSMESWSSNKIKPAFIAAKTHEEAIILAKKYLEELNIKQNDNILDSDGSLVNKKNVEEIQLKTIKFASDNLIY